MVQYPKFLDAYMALPYPMRNELCFEILGEWTSLDTRVVINEATMIAEEIWRGNVSDDYLDQFFGDNDFQGEV